MEHGFQHLQGLTELWKMTLVNNKYLTDDSMEMLAHVTKDKLKWLHLARNGNISDRGIQQLGRMKKLEYLKLESLQEMKNPRNVLQELESKLPNCQIEFPPYTESQNNENWDNICKMYLLKKKLNFRKYNIYISNNNSAAITIIYNLVIMSGTEM